MTNIRIILISLFILSACFSQENNSTLFKQLDKHYKNFEYTEVIRLADQLAAQKDSLSGQTFIEVLRMQAIAYYSLDQTENAQNTFQQILNIDENFELDSRENSPKIISFFNDIKLDFLSQQIIPEKEAEKIKEVSDMLYQFENYKKGMLRSIIWPGWGHYYVDETSKARLLNLAGFLTLVPGIYYAFETAKLEKDYLNESNPRNIEGRYNKYNDAYRYRNYLLTAFSVVWIYAQYDYFFRDQSVSGSQTIFINPQIEPYSKGLVINLHVAF